MGMTPRFFSILLVVGACAGSQRPRAASVAPAAEMAPVAAPEPTHAAPMPPAEKREQSGFSDVNTDNSLISNGSVQASSEQLLSTASGFRREVYRLGGRVFAEQVHYRADS